MVAVKQEYEVELGYHTLVLVKETVLVYNVLG